MVLTMNTTHFNLMNNLHNLAQTVRAKVNLRPANCFCKECEPGQIYRCASCKKLTPWCMGADDYLFDCCDDCFGQLYDEITDNQLKKLKGIDDEEISRKIKRLKETIDNN
jgi:hypothetical protein